MRTISVLALSLLLWVGEVSAVTRFRLPASGSSACSPSVQTYTHSGSTSRPLPTSDSTALGTSAVTPDAGDDLTAGDTFHVQFVSAALAAQTFTAGDAFDFAVQGLEAHANNNLNIQIFIGIVSNDCTSALATLRSKQEESTELATSLTNRYHSGTLSGSYTTSGGERLVIEFSVEGTPASGGGVQGHNASLRFGSNGAGGDAPENDTETGTTVNPWFEFANTIQFQTGFALVAHTTASGVNGGTSAGINTTGANLIVISASWFTSTTANVTISDSNTSTWTPLTKQTVFDYATQLFYTYAPTVGASHTFTVSGSSTFSNIEVLAFSGAASSPFDQQNGATTTSGSTLSTGSVTPGQDNEVVVAGLGWDSVAGTVSIDNGFTISDTVAWSSGTNIGGSAAYKIQTSAAAVNPQWNIVNTTAISAAIATFKASGGGGSTECRNLALLGVGASCAD